MEKHPVACRCRQCETMWNFLSTDHPVDYKIVDEDHVQANHATLLPFTKELFRRGPTAVRVIAQLMDSGYELCGYCAGPIRRGAESCEHCGHSFVEEPRDQDLKDSYETSQARAINYQLTH